MHISETGKGLICVCGAVLYHFVLGTVYTFGNISPYISSYLKIKTSNTWVTNGQTVWIFAGHCLFFGGFMWTAGILREWIGLKLVCIIACIILNLFVALTYFAIKFNLWMVVFTYGLCSGLGTALTYSLVLEIAIKWFPHRSGIVSGFVSGGLSLGTFVYTFVQTKIINPWNVSPIRINITSSNNMLINEEKYFYDERVLNNIPICFVIMGVSCFFIQLVSVAMLIDHDEYESNDKLVGDGKADKENETSDEERMLLTSIEERESQASDKIEDYTVLQATKTSVFWVLMIINLLTSFFVVLISVQYKTFGQQFIDDDQYFAILGAVSGILNCLSRPIWGQLCDAFKFRIVMSVLSALMSITIGTIYFCSFITNQTAAKVVYFIMVCLLFVAQGGKFVLFPSVTVQCFGAKYLAIILGLFFLGSGLASIVIAVVCSYSPPWMQYKGQFIVTTIASVITFILTQFFRETQHTDKVSSKKI